MTTKEQSIRAAVIAALALARERDGLTQRALAERAGMTEGNLSDWLSGHTNITDATADRVLRVLGLVVRRGKIAKE